jgi:DNA modification methylase
MPTLKIEYQDPERLHPRSRNPRTHSSKQIGRIAESLKEFGFVNPVLIDRSNSIIAGHGRVAAAKFLGMRDVPTVCVDHLTPAQLRAYVIADNRLAELAGWDRKLLALEFRELSVEFDFDVSVTGFDIAEVDVLINEVNEEALNDWDKTPRINKKKPPISIPGDLWRIGEHHLFCGNALDPESYTRLLGGAKAQMVFTDPPYNLSITKALRAKTIKRREFPMASGEMTAEEYREFLKATFVQLCAASTDGSIHFVCIDWRHVRDLLEAGEEVYSELKNICLWAKTQAGMGSLYRSQHEFVCVFKNGTGAHVNNVELGRFGRNRSNVWHYAGPLKHTQDGQIGHPTIKPVSLVADAIMDCSARADRVLDAFAGSGTTLIAAQRTGRIGYGIELDPHYVDAIIRRFSDVCGLNAAHVRTGKSFDTIARERGRK